MPMGMVIAEDLWVPLPDGFGDGMLVVYNPALADDRPGLLSLGPGTAGLVVRNRTQVDAELLAHFPDLRVVGRLGVGLDNIDVAACRARGVDVVAATGFNATSVAEYVVACLLQHARPLWQWSAAVKAGTWRRQAAIGRELHGKTLGLIGIGDIGQRVATRARALGLRVMAFDPFVLPSHAVVRDFGVWLAPLETVLETANFVSVHVPLTPATRHLLDGEALARMRDDGVLINTARGGVIDEAALALALSRSPRRFAYLDVREVEPPGPADALAALDNVCLTPHIAGITEESSRAVADYVLAEVAARVRG
ncbi:MAG: hydroxyacid dehydrogenase [Alicyclobacillus sp.]|nr:hydroxyacid dehydrogenase [Alicyclobacillus sp.]